MTHKDPLAEVLKSLRHKITEQHYRDLEELLLAWRDKQVLQATQTYRREWIPKADVAAAIEADGLAIGGQAMRKASDILIPLMTGLPKPPDGMHVTAPSLDLVEAQAALLKDLLGLLPKEYHLASQGYNNGWNDYRDQAEQTIREYLS